MAGKAKMVEAVAYIRTSSAANVGANKDSDKRQRQAIESFAKANGYQLVGEFYDAAVSGADPIADRDGFTAIIWHRSHGGIRSTLPIGYWESMIIEVCLPKPQAPSDGRPVRIRLQS